MDSPLFRPAAITAAACTAVQAGVWMVLSLLGVLTSAEVLGPKDWNLLTSTATSNEFNYVMTFCYFPRDVSAQCCTDMILRGNGMLAISIVYLIFSLAWLCTAVLLLQDLTNKGKMLKELTLTWAGVTGVIALMDLIIAILFGVDYANVLKDCKLGAGMLLSVTGFLMSLTARGYVLWVINVVAAVLLARAALGDSSERMKPRRSSDSSGSTVYNSPADAVQESRSYHYQSGDRPWVLSAGTLPRQSTRPSMHQPPLGAWDRPDSTQPYQNQQQYQPPQQQRAPPGPPGPGGYGQPVNPAEMQRGGLAARMTQGSSSEFGSQRSRPAPPSAPQQSSRPTRSIPEPDYDAGHQQPRSVLKKTSAAPASHAGDWRQPAPQQQQQQSGRGWSTQPPPQPPPPPPQPQPPPPQPQPPPQRLPPMSPDGRGGWGPSSASDNRWGGYDNRGYDNRNDNRSWHGDAGAGDRWGRTGF